MKAREGSRRFSDSKKRLAPGEVLRKMSWRQGVVCEKLSRRLQEFGKKLLGVQRVNKSNSMAGAMQVEANLQEQLGNHLHFRKLECCYNDRYLKSDHMFALALTVSEILKFHIFDLEKVGQGHFVYHSLANIQIYKVALHIFTLALTVLQILTF